MRILSLYLLFALNFDVSSPKRGGSSGAGSRGSNSGGLGSKGGGSRPGGWSSGGSRPAGGGSWSSGGRPMGGTAGSFSGSSGGKSGFLSGSTSKGLAYGLAGGALAGAGTALLVSSLASGGRYRSPDGNYYYYGDRNYPSQVPSGKIKCVYEIQPNDTKLNNLWYDNTTKVQEIIYECRLGYERCCNGLECCKLENQQVYVTRQQKSGISWWGGLLIGLMFVSVFACIGYCIYTRVRKSDNATGPDATYVTSYVETEPNAYPQQPQYPGQPQPFAYPQQPYQAAYPNQPQAGYGSYPGQPMSQQPPAYPGYPTNQPSYGFQHP